jgi:hypothetical protein
MNDRRTTCRRIRRRLSGRVPADRIANRLSPMDRRFFRSRASEISAQDVLDPQLVRAQRSQGIAHVWNTSTPPLASDATLFWPPTNRALLRTSRRTSAPGWVPRSREAKTSEDHSDDELAATVSINNRPWRRRLGDVFQKT